MFKEGEPEKMIEDLDFQTFAALADVLGKGKTKLDEKDNSIYNVKS
ncbi:hypothetical protein M2347_001780 [Chryseobacterium sp. H1D6B]|nr:hypothetical protein [Chryseobacterium sp. H1D6B]MDH6252053.1 hypothetical protein [Chryseobacterium sp. H1D6B]